MTTDGIREQLARLLDGVDAHMTFEEAVADFPDEAINRFPPNVEYTPWQLVEHLRIAQEDIVRYIAEPAYESPPWPEGYWPARDATSTPEGFAATVSAFLADRATLRAVVEDAAVDLFAPLPHTPGHTIAREVRIIADHNAYHTGEFAILRQVMGTWQPSHDGG
jgi:hypothetical protein